MQTAGIAFAFLASPAVAVTAADVEEIHELEELAYVCSSYNTNTFSNDDWLAMMSMATTINNKAEQSGLSLQDIRSLEDSGYDRARYRVDVLWTSRAEVLDDCLYIFQRSEEILEQYR